MAYHIRLGKPGWSWSGRIVRMRERTFKYSLRNNDLVICEVRCVKGTKYEGGVMFTFRCMSSDGKTLFAIENSHGQPHIHLGGRRESVEYDWKTAYWKFDQMLREHKRKIGQVD